MTSTNHTTKRSPLPESWEATPYGDHWSFAYTLERQEREDYDFRIEFNEAVDDAEMRAVVSLIEAAPKMLAALLALKTANGATNFTGWHESFDEAIALANTAIAEATGEAA